MVSCLTSRAALNGKYSFTLHQVIFKLIHRDDDPVELQYEPFTRTYTRCVVLPLSRYGTAWVLLYFLYGKPLHGLTFVVFILLASGPYATNSTNTVYRLQIITNRVPICPDPQLCCTVNLGLVSIK
jgi:hypothetical protein